MAVHMPVVVTKDNPPEPIETKKVGKAKEKSAVEILAAEWVRLKEREDAAADLHVDLKQQREKKHEELMAAMTAKAAPAAKKK
jgi:hypothetical protein